jgi:hypothetical protein
MAIIIYFTLKHIKKSLIICVVIVQMFFVFFCSTSSLKINTELCRLIVFNDQVVEVFGKNLLN